MTILECIGMIYLGVIIIVAFCMLGWCVKLDDKQKTKRIEFEKKRNELLNDINEKLFIMITKEKE